MVFLALTVPKPGVIPTLRNRNAEIMFTMPIDQKPRWQGTIKTALAAIRAAGQGLMYAVLLVLMLPIVFLLCFPLRQLRRKTCAS